MRVRPDCENRQMDAKTQAPLTWDAPPEKCPACGSKGHERYALPAIWDYDCNLSVTRFETDGRWHAWTVSQDISGCRNAFAAAISLRAEVERQARRALEAERALMLSGHKCRPIARAVHESDGRETWVGELLEPIPDWPAETHCLHITTPLKSVVFGFNNGDIEQMAVLMQVAHGGPINPNWLNLMADRMRRAALAAAGTPAGQGER